MNHNIIWYDIIWYNITWYDMILMDKRAEAHFTPVRCLCALRLRVLRGKRAYRKAAPGNLLDTHGLHCSRLIHLTRLRSYPSHSPFRPFRPCWVPFSPLLSTRRDLDICGMHLIARRDLDIALAQFIPLFALAEFGRTLEAPIPKMSGLVKKVGPFSKRKNPL